MLIPEIFERHARLIGHECFKKLANSSALVAGIGGLGSTVAQLLARTGIGTLHLVDFDRVEENNLNRQILYTRQDIGRYKVDVAAKRLKEIVPHIKIVPHRERISPEFALPDVDVVVDCLDNFSDRFVLDMLAEDKNIPLVHGGVARFHGQVTVIKYGETQTIRDIFEEVEDKDKISVFPPLVTLVGSIEASEAIKLLCDLGPSLVGKLLLIDLLANTIDTIDL